MIDLMKGFAFLFKKCMACQDGWVGKQIEWFSRDLLGQEAMYGRNQEKLIEKRTCI